ncbi:hypothetical protein [uncultured Roseobacter sp.]|uniref:hypothetical protein n=1 Tax=uncultured Roseobacter sp. TaxID=114847 RepID=UPI0026348BBB|nr:hypothetical protein [uncultured Roseobacter sp.]
MDDDMAVVGAIEVGYAAAYRKSLPRSVKIGKNAAFLHAGVTILHCFMRASLGKPPVRERKAQRECESHIQGERRQ